MKRYLIIILLSILLMIGQWGCAHVPSYRPPSFSDQIKAELGTIGVVSARFKPREWVQAPLGKKGGAKAGAIDGAKFVIYPLNGPPPPPPPPQAALGALFLLPIGAGVGALVGAMRGVSDSKKEEAEALFNSLIAELKIQETMREHILNIAQEKTIYHLSLIEELGPTSFYEKVNYNSLGTSGINTVLEISVWGWELRGEGRINPPLSFYMDVIIRIFRVGDGKELYNECFKYEGREKSKFTRWAANNGQLFKEELNRGCRSLAEEIVKKLFLTPES